MSKYITIKLTEDQIRALAQLAQEYSHNLDDVIVNHEGGRIALDNEKAWWRRLCAKLS